MALQQLLITAAVFMMIMVIAANVVASMSPCLDWDSLPSTIHNQKQSIIFSCGFSGGRKLKPALFLPQGKGLMRVPVPLVMATVLSPFHHGAETVSLSLP